MVGAVALLRPHVALDLGATERLGEVVAAQGLEVREIEVAVVRGPIDGGPGGVAGAEVEVAVPARLVSPAVVQEVDPDEGHPRVIGDVCTRLRPGARVALPRCARPAGPARPVEAARPVMVGETAPAPLALGLGAGEIGAPRAPR